ncbi:MAG: hypothetical protein JW902_12755, partial [Syntrophaceae bacterium]|nr:hypothetical protein [Syntrophaceae bacterium]
DPPPPRTPEEQARAEARRRRGRPILGPLAEPGLYQVTLKVDGVSAEKTVLVRRDPLKSQD